MSTIPYIDPADGKLLDVVSPEKAEHFVAIGIAHPMRTKTGRIRRLYRRTCERAYGSAKDGVWALHAASVTTQRIRGVEGIHIAGPRIREHKQRGKIQDYYQVPGRPEVDHAE